MIAVVVAVAVASCVSKNCIFHGGSGQGVTVIQDNELSAIKH